MKKYLIYLAMSTLMFTGCVKHEFNIGVSKEQVNENVKKVFGTEFDANHDWCTTTAGEVTINGISSNVEKVKLLTYVAESDENTSLLVLNEANVTGESNITLTYDMPSTNLGLFAALYSDGSYSIKKVDGNSVNFAKKARTRALPEEYVLPTTTPVIGGTTVSFASERGWLPGQVLYDAENQSMTANDYSDEYKEIFRTVIFSYFKNGRNYNNLPLIKESGYYNDKVYPITTGKDPIVVSPVYKSDKATTFGNEIYNSDLYYYYFKESDLEGKDEVEYLNSLPKYKAIAFDQHFDVNEDDIISKRTAYLLVFWGEGEPYVGKTGSYTFPEGYKIGFMVRAKTTHDNFKKQGELYGDGRLNDKINKFGNFNTSGLDVDDPRMGWITVENKMLLCVESGTDKDFNDIILEVEGGVEEIINIPEFEYNSYTFCFEDTELGDYDLNDVVIKGTRTSETTVEWRLVACGAYDELKIMNINGKVINSNTEVHKLFGADGGFINTETKNYEEVVETVKVGKKFSFLKEDTQPYIYDMSTGVTVKLARKGEDPHGIMIPNDFRYPKEKICVKNAYYKFNEWGQNRVTSTYWYKYPNLDKVF